MSALLLDEPPVLVQPSLVRRLGLLEAAIVQQLHYWSARATRTHDGHAYVYKTYQDWSAEIGVSAKQARGAMDRLRREGIVIAMQNPSDPRDRTLWWRIDHAVLTGAPSDPEGRSPLPAGDRPPAPGGTSNAGASEGRTETTSETPQQRAHAKAMQLPDDFPEPLKPHARDVFRILRSVAEQHHAREVTPRAVGHAMMGEPGRHYVAEAHALAAWAQAPPRPIRDVVGTYRTWLQRAQAYAGTESLGEPVAASAAPNVHHIRPGETRFDRAQESLRVLHDQLVAEGR
jgi:hypothetical protein